MQTYREHSYSRSRVYERSGQDLELQDVISEESNSISDSSETEANPEDSEDTTQRREADLYQKLSAIQWRKVFTLFVVAINCFLVNGSNSLIATFFPTEVMLTLKFTIKFNFYVWLCVLYKINMHDMLALHTELLVNCYSII